MEFTGLKTCLHKILSDWKLSIECLVTDRHRQIRAYMRDTYGPSRKVAANPEITHYVDIWHCAKSEHSFIWYFVISVAGSIFFIVFFCSSQV
jgi:hypothetical protein